MIIYRLDGIHIRRGSEESAYRKGCAEEEQETADSTNEGQIERDRRGKDCNSNYLLSAEESLE